MVYFFIKEYIKCNILAEHIFAQHIMLDLNEYFRRESSHYISTIFIDIDRVVAKAEHFINRSILIMKHCEIFKIFFIFTVNFFSFDN